MIGYIVLRQFEWTPLANQLIETALRDISTLIHVFIDIKASRLIIQENAEGTFSNKFRYEFELEESDLSESYHFQIQACALRNNLRSIDNKKLIKIFIHHDHFEFTIHDKLFNVPPWEVGDEDKDIAHVTFVEKSDTFDITSLSNSHTFEISSETLASKLTLIKNLNASENDDSVIISENDSQFSSLNLIFQVGQNQCALLARKERWFTKLTCNINTKTVLTTEEVGIAPPILKKLIKIIDKVEDTLKITFVNNSIILSQKHWHFILPTSQPKWDYGEDLSLLSINELSKLDLWSKSKKQLYLHTKEKGLNKAAYPKKARVYLKNDIKDLASTSYTLKLNLDQDGSDAGRHVDLATPLFEVDDIISLSLWCLSETLAFFKSISWQYDKRSSGLVITDHNEDDYVVLFCE